MASPTPPAQQAGIPLNTPGAVLDPSDPAFAGVFSQPWFYLLQLLWRKLGGNFSTPQNMVYAVSTATNKVTFYSVNTGVVIGHVTTTPGP